MIYAVSPSNSQVFEIFFLGKYLRVRNSSDRSICVGPTGGLGLRQRLGWNIQSSDSFSGLRFPIPVASKLQNKPTFARAHTRTLALEFWY